MRRATLLADLPLCQMCGQRIAVSPRCIEVSDDADRTLLALLRRRFIEHEDDGGARCSGSGQTLAVARGREEDNA